MTTESLVLAKSIVSKLKNAGFKAYFAGGWVRDFLMDHPSEDIDIATGASPSEIMDLFSQTILVGLAFGVVIVILEGHQFEVATFRKDLQYLDGRHPQGIEMSSPLEDALRRDFTINGMFYDPLENVIHDYVHGQEDVSRRVIRTIGNPHDRFFEDRLRMLRAFRFAARFEFSIDIDTQEAIRENAPYFFPAVAMERVWQEFNKMSAYPRFDQALIEMHRLSLLEEILPEVKGIHIKDLRDRVSGLVYFPSSCPTILYLMEIVSSLPLSQKIEIAKRLKASNKDLKNVEFLEALNREMASEQTSSLIDLHRWATLFAQSDWELVIKILAIRYARQDRENFYQKYLQRYRLLEPHIVRIKTGKPLISAAVLQKYGVAPGKKMGLLLKEAEKLVVNENKDDPEEVINYLSCLSLWQDGEFYD